MFSNSERRETMAKRNEYYLGSIVTCLHVTPIPGEIEPNLSLLKPGNNYKIVRTRLCGLHLRLAFENDYNELFVADRFQSVEVPYVTL